MLEVILFVVGFLLGFLASFLPNPRMCELLREVERLRKRVAEQPRSGWHCTRCDEYVGNDCHLNADGTWRCGGVPAVWERHRGAEER